MGNNVVVVVHVWQLCVCVCVKMQVLSLDEWHDLMQEWARLYCHYTVKPVFKGHLNNPENVLHTTDIPSSQVLQHGEEKVWEWTELCLCKCVTLLWNRDWSRWDFIECFTTTFLRAHSWLNWVDEDDDEIGLKENKNRSTGSVEQRT